MNRPWQIWLVVGLCLAVLVAVMVWISATVVRLDSAEAKARQLATLEENVRLALWRMDSALAGVIAQENARPYFAYSAFYPAERAYTRMFAEIEKGEVLVPSPLLSFASPFLRLHFQFGPDGELTSPQAPTGNMRDLAEMKYTTYEKIEAASRRVKALSAFSTRDSCLAALDKAPRWVISAAPNAERPQTGAQQGGRAVPSQAEQQSLRSSAELEMRNQVYVQQSRQKYRPSSAAARMTEEDDNLMKPIWMGEELLLVRRVAVNGQQYVQGCWLDWPTTRNWLLKEIRDLVPEATLEQVKTPTNVASPRMLASLPVRIEPGKVPMEPREGLSPIRLSLVLAWVCVLLAGAAVCALLFGAVSLSERRGAFVSAVTHELRTPLTTFRMYSEMLAEGMVTDEEKRKQYLSTLCREADRLSHLVENVLAYARLERGRARGTPERTSLQSIMQRSETRLAERARQAGMNLVVEAGDTGEDLQVLADVSAVEQILLNLVDNACKYAAGAADARIHIELVSSDGNGVLRVRDHGQGISRDDAARLFRPFSKSAKDAAHSAPGVGLGLALSRRLARAMGGDLRLDASVQDGACFALSLPKA